MGVIAVLVFIGVFAAIALPMAAAAPSDHSKKALATLDAALKGESKQVARQQNMNLRKDEQLSSIPWLNKGLLKFDLAPYLRKMLSQAQLDWSPGRLLIMTVACCLLPSYFLFLSFQSYPLALLVGVWQRHRRRSDEPHLGLHERRHGLGNPGGGARHG